MSNGTKMVVVVAGVLGIVAGIAIGVGLEARPASAQVARFTECTSATMWISSGADMNQGRLEQTVRIPPGWTVIGGGGTNRPQPSLIICR